LGFVSIRMKRVRRIILNTLTVLSLLLFAATVLMWVRSHFVCDRFNWGESWRGHSGDGGIMTTVGLVEFWHRTFIVPCDPRLRNTEAHHDTYSPPNAMNFLDDGKPMPFWHKLGFSWEEQHMNHPSWGSGQGVWDYFNFTVPFWFVTMITLLLPHRFGMN